MSHGGEGVSNADGSPVPERRGVGLGLRCPCGCESRLYVPFANPLDGGPNPDKQKGWQRSGDTFDTPTLSPSILRGDPCPKRWHGFIINGEVRPC